MTRLVTVAHGTRNQVGNEVARRITAAAAARLGIAATTSFVELCEPSFADVVAGGGDAAVSGEQDETVVVPLLLSRGYHVAVDLPAAVLAARGTVTLAPPLGPHGLLAEAMAARLAEAGAVSGQPCVVVAAGSRDPRGAADLAATAALLAGLRGSEVRVAAHAGDLPRPADLVTPDDAVVPYLLAPGFFADRTTRDSRAAGATVVADVLGVHPRVVDLVVERASAVLGPVKDAPGHPAVRRPSRASAGR